MGEKKNHGLRVSFTDKLKVHFKGSEVTSDGGLIAIRELDERLGLTTLAETLGDRLNILQPFLYGAARRPW